MEAYHSMFFKTQVCIELKVQLNWDLVCIRYDIFSAIIQNNLLFLLVIVHLV